MAQVSSTEESVKRVNYHRPCRWLCWETTTPDNVIRCCLSIVAFGLPFLLLPAAFLYIPVLCLR